MISGVSNNTFAFQTQFSKNHNQQNEVLKRLSTGRRINSGKDDPAGLIVASRLQAELTAVDAESRAVERLNANANITDGHLARLSTMTSDLHTHLLAGANKGGTSDADVVAYQFEIDSISSRLQRFAYDAIESLEGMKLPDDGNEKLAEGLASAAASVTTLTSGGANDLYSGNLEEAQTVIQGATTAFAEARGTVGAYQRNTLETRLNSLAVERESLLTAHSQIVDADFAEEAANLARAKVLTASSVQVLKIANDNASTVLSLLK